MLAKYYLLEEIASNLAALAVQHKFSLFLLFSRLFQILFIPSSLFVSRFFRLVCREPREQICLNFFCTCSNEEKFAEKIEEIKN